MHLRSRKINCFVVKMVFCSRFMETCTYVPLYRRRRSEPFTENKQIINDVFIQFVLAFVICKLNYWLRVHYKDLSSFTITDAQHIITDNRCGISTQFFFHSNIFWVNSESFSRTIKICHDNISLWQTHMLSYYIIVFLYFIYFRNFIVIITLKLW